MYIYIYIYILLVTKGESFELTWSIIAYIMPNKEKGWINQSTCPTIFSQLIT